MNPLDDLVAVYWDAVRAVDPGSLISSCVKKENGKLIIDNHGDAIFEDLSSYKEVIVLGIGKASARMAAAIEQVLGDELTRGLVITKYGHAVKTKKIKVMEAGHPLPDENSLQGARKLVEMAKKPMKKRSSSISSPAGARLFFAFPRALSPSRIKLRQQSYFWPSARISTR